MLLSGNELQIVRSDDGYTQIFFFSEIDDYIMCTL